jgi:hypothetical protein
MESHKRSIRLLERKKRNMDPGEANNVCPTSLYFTLKCGSLKLSKINICCWTLVAQACNPRYSGGRDQEDRGLKPALGK